MNTPINSVQLGGTEPLCKHTVAWPTPAATWTAGETVKLQFGSDAASHSGGHAEFSISYDGGHTFVVIEMVLRYIFVGTKPASPTNDVSIFDYDLKLPDNLPASDKAIFAWTWVNASGNREFYMNCADVEIKGTSTSISGKNVTIANYPGYPTIAEFNGNYDTGIQYYTTDITLVTVNANGKSEVISSKDADFVYYGQNGTNSVIYNLLTIGNNDAGSSSESESNDSVDDSDDESLDWCDDESDDESWEWCDDDSTSSCYACPVVPTIEPELMCDADYYYADDCPSESESDVYYSDVYVSNTFLESDLYLNPLVLASAASEYEVTVTQYETSTIDDESDSDGLGGLDDESSSDSPESSTTSPFSYSHTSDLSYPQFEYSSTSSSS
ncbi:hypothetical protein EV175_003575 [Coemansia sp. RSA 1933]|nr:hypothetical protein EV175_003575 [Coemansia sp. RSA 1933]